MTFRDLYEKGEGKVYLAKAKYPTSVIEVVSILVTKEVATQRNYYYFGWYERNRPFSFVLARKSLDKRRTRRDGLPSVVDFNSCISYIALNLADLNRNKIEYDGYIIFLDKEAACDYVVDKIKRKKLKLNGQILKINKLKFSLK